jgi:carboxyl-terminal processing protease
VRSLRGEVGTSVTITIARGEAGETLDLTLTRDRVESRAVSHRVEGTDIGYLRVAAFNERTTTALQRSLRALRTEMGSRMRGIVIDLRNNPGGYLDQAVNVADAFLDGGEVVSTRGRDGVDFGRYGAKPGTLVPDVPVVVIINSASASAAEVVAGALQDRERATIIGMRSFGKGSVQSEIALGAQRGALRLTTSRYYTPSGRSIQGTGITPDLEIAQQRLSDEEIRRINLRSEATLPNALENETGEQREGPHIPAEMPPEGYEGEDYQLERALQIVREKADTGRRLAQR